MRGLDCLEQTVYKNSGPGAPVDSSFAVWRAAPCGQ